MAEPNLELTPGASASWIVSVYRERAAMDLAILSKAWLTIKQADAWDVADPGIVQLALGTGLALEGAATAGKLRATLAPGQTALFTAGTSYVWSVRLLFQDGAVEDPRGLRGTVTVNPNITKSNS